MLDKTLSITTDALGPHNPITLQTQCELAISYTRQDQFKRAAEALEHALSSLEEEFNNNYLLTIKARKLLGDIYY
jgi:hypothetical protein